MAEVYDSQSSAGGLERQRVAQPAREEPSIATLLGELVADAQDLVRKEVDLAKQEVKIEIGKAKDSAISLGIGAAVAAIGGLLLIFMLVHFLNEVVNLRLWVSYLIVGGLLAIVGGILLMRAKSKASEINLVPRETISEVRKDVEWIKQQTPSDKI